MDAGKGVFLYQCLQHLYAKNPSAAATKVLEGSWCDVPPVCNLKFDDMKTAWEPIFTKSSVWDSSVVGNVLWELVSPVTVSEIETSAAGPDRMTYADLNNIPKCELISHFNLWLLVGSQPMD